MTTNMTKEFLSMIQKMIEIWRNWMGCEEQHYHKTDTQSRPKYPWFDLQFKLYNRKKNDKVIQANLSKKVWIWKCVFHLSIMKIWASSRKSNQGSNKEYGTKPMIGIQCKKMINEHIPKYRVSDNKVKRCVEPRNEDKSHREKTC